MSTWFNLASARDIIYIYVCVCVCVCVRVCVCVHVAISQESKRQVCLPWWPHQTCHALSVGGFKDGIRWILLKQKKCPLSEKDIGRVTHSENTYGRTTHGKYMFKTNYSLNQIVFPTIFRPQNCCEPTVLENENSQCCWSCNSCTFMLTIINLKCLD